MSFCFHFIIIQIIILIISEYYDDTRPENLDNESNEHRDILVNMSNTAFLESVSSPEWPALPQTHST